MAVIRKKKGKHKPAPSASAGEGEELITAAKQTAQDLKTEAEQHVEELVREALDVGQQEGFSEAAHMREEIGGLEQRMVSEVDGEIMRSALRVARRLIEAEIEKNPAALTDIAVAALASATDAREVFLRVNPRAAAALRNNKQRLKDALAVAKQVDVREDSAVPLGGVLIQTESGVVDAQIETQLDEIARLLGM